MRKFLVSTIASSPSDMRYYAKITLLEFSEYGLLDTGANISCIGAELALHKFSKYLNFSKCKSFVKTADGQTQTITGWIDVAISFREQTWPMKHTINIIASDNPRINMSEVKSVNQNCKIWDQLEQSLEDFYPLRNQKLKQLASVIELFQNFEK